MAAARMLSRSHSIAVYTHTVKYALQKNNDDSLTEHLKKRLPRLWQRVVTSPLLIARRLMLTGIPLFVCRKSSQSFEKTTRTSGINVLKTGTNAWKSVLNIAKNSLKNNKW